MEFYTSDLCDKYKDDVQVALPLFKSYGGKSYFEGEIVTIRLQDNNKDLVTLLKTNGKGKVAVVDVDAKYVAVVGDILMGFAQENHWSGILINGYVRDIVNTKNIEVGLFALGTCPKKCPEPSNADIGITLNFAGVKFENGNYIYADEDGIIVSKTPLSM